MRAGRTPSPNAGARRPGGELRAAPIGGDHKATRTRPGRRGRHLDAHDGNRRRAGAAGRESRSSSSTATGSASKWGDDGPQSGYFPFYIGLLLGLSSLGTLAHVAFDRMAACAAVPRRGRAARRASSSRGSTLKLVLSVLLPALVYVLAVQLIGIYVASALYITLFMRWLGHYRWLKSVADRRAGQRVDLRACSRSGSRSRCSRAPTTRSPGSATEPLPVRGTGRSWRKQPWSRSARSFTASRSCCRHSTCC